MSSWEPSPDSLQQLAACLKDSLSGFNKTAQKQADLVRLCSPIAMRAPAPQLTIFFADASAGQELA
jgi:hypothetical protein